MGSRERYSVPTLDQARQQAEYELYTLLNGLGPLAALDSDEYFKYDRFDSGASSTDGPAPCRSIRRGRRPRTRPAVRSSGVFGPASALGRQDSGEALWERGGVGRTAEGPD